MSDLERPPDVQKSASTLLDLYREAISSISDQNETARELSRLIDEGFKLAERRLEQVTDQLRAQSEALRAQTTAIEARSAVWRDLSTGLLKWLEYRWVSLLIGLAFGLGLSGARELFLALVGSMVGQATPIP